jgi:hypothetical protein
MRLSLICRQVITNGGVNIQRYQHAKSTGALVVRLSFTACGHFAVEGVRNLGTLIECV